MIAAILGRKLGMTQMFVESGTGGVRRIPVTVIEAGPCSVIQVKTVEGDGYNAVQLGFGDKKLSRANKPESGHFKKAGVRPKRFVREVRCGEKVDVKPGATVTVDVLGGVKKVDIEGVSKGKGWAGTIKRWGFSQQRMSHGNSKHHRHPGGIGRLLGTSKGVPKGKKMAGRMGGGRVTALYTEVVKLDSEKNLLLVRGSVPGANGGYVVVRASMGVLKKEE